MLFNSYEFLFAFLPITFIGFFILGKYASKDAATLWLVSASFFFYGWWDYRYVPLLFASICFNYLIGRQLEKNNGNKSVLSFGILGNVLLLGYFKYTDFFLASVNMAMGTDYFSLLHIALPLGISFFTFTQTAYLVDAYRGETKNESFLTYCEFVTIFPHLIAGPIINHKEMIPQFVADKTFKPDYKNIAMGITLFAMGLFKKVIIADRFALWANFAFTHTDSLTFIEAWVGALSYTLQLFFDFSAYSEMAIGLGLMFNLKFPVNFNLPYKSTSIIDFWRRWHMTLGTWVRDYLYIPMGGNRHGELSKMKNLFLSMLIIGLWHGAGWTFIFWGAMHGAALMINHQWRRLNISLPKYFNWGITFLCVMLLWVFFRADSFSSAWNVITAMTDIYNIGVPKNILPDNYVSYLSIYGITASDWRLPSDLHVIIALITVFSLLPSPMDLMKKFSPNLKWALLTILLLIYSITSLNSYSEFLYFQF